MPSAPMSPFSPRRDRDRRPGCAASTPLAARLRLDSAPPFAAAPYTLEHASHPGVSRDQLVRPRPGVSRLAVHHDRPRSASRSASRCVGLHQDRRPLDHEIDQRPQLRGHSGRADGRLVDQHEPRRCTSGGARSASARPRPHKRRRARLGRRALIAPVAQPRDLERAIDALGGRAARAVTCRDTVRSASTGQAMRVVGLRDTRTRPRVLRLAGRLQPSTSAFPSSAIAAPSAASLVVDLRRRSAEQANALALWALEIPETGDSVIGRSA